jgi:hypothetical protein
MFKHASCDTYCNPLWRDRCCDIRLEHRCNNFNHQYEHCRNLQRDGYGYERMHGLRFWYVDRQSEPHSVD